MKLDKILIRGSVVLLIFFGIYNFLNFMFHFSMARLLGVEEFGTLSALYAIIYMLGIFTESIQLVFTKFSSGEQNKSKIKGMLKASSKKFFVYSLVIFMLYAIATIKISDLMKIDYPLMLLNGLMIFLAFSLPLTRGIIQGKKRFRALGANMVSESAFKLVISLILVFLGWGVYGAIIGTLIGTGTALALSFVSLGDIMSSKSGHIKKQEKYSLPSFIIIFSILAFYSIDVIIAKIVFSDGLAGAYSIASILAKTIFLGTQPISRAMFPISSENELKKNKSEGVFYNAFGLLIVPLFIGLVLFFFFPSFIVWIFSGKVILESSSIFFYLSIGFVFIYINNLVLLYKLSLGKVKNYQYLPVFLILEVFLLYYFSANLFQFSIAFVTASAAFLWGTIVILRD